MDSWRPVTDNRCMAIMETAALVLIVVSRVVEAVRKIKNNDLSPPAGSAFGPPPGSGPPSSPGPS